MRVMLSLAVLALPVLAWQREGSFERTLTVSGPVDLEAETHAGRITVRSGDAAAVRIHATIHVNREDAGDADARVRAIESNPPIQQSGNTIHITRVEDESLRRHLSISYEIVTPAATKLRARTGSGGVTVEGVQGPVDAASGSGSVEITRIGGEVRAHTGSGRVTLDSIQGKVDAQTGSGSITAHAVTGPSVLHTGSGSLHLDQTTAAAVQAHTGSGSVEVKLPTSSGYEVRAHTGSGQVYVDQPITVSGSIGGREVKGLIRGGGPLVEVSTGSGGVRIE